MPAKPVVWRSTERTCSATPRPLTPITWLPQARTAARRGGVGRVVKWVKWGEVIVVIQITQFPHLASIAPTFPTLLG